jgi:hypothetical protein
MKIIKCSGLKLISQFTVSVIVVPRSLAGENLGKLGLEEARGDKGVVLCIWMTDDSSLLAHLCGVFKS